MWTEYGYRVNKIQEGVGYDWLFLPGGPGLGAEYVAAFASQLCLPGNVYAIDFPMDGTNTQGVLHYKFWMNGLFDLLTLFKKPILVTHSFASMFALSLPNLEKYLQGFVVMNSTTKNSFFEHVESMRLQYDLPDLMQVASEYHLDPTQEKYRSFWKVYKHYVFTSNELSAGESMLSLFAFNNDSYYYALQSFFPNYACQFIPLKIPTMIMASELDFVCPPAIFLDDERYHRNNILHKMILNAGHCPWLNQLESVQMSFDEYISLHGK